MQMAKKEDRIRCGKHKSVADGDGNSSRKQKQKAQSTPRAEAAAVTNAKFKGKGKAQYTPKKRQSGNSILDQPCPIHTKTDEEGNVILPKHTTRQCRLLIQAFGEGQPSEKDIEQDDEDKEDPFPQVHATLMIFADVESKSRVKLVNREVNTTTPSTPMFLKWSQTAITFDQSDHPAHVPTTERQALVVNPVVEGVRLRKVPMDGGSDLNIMYADTLKGMGIPMSKLSESSMHFHGVVLGRKAKSLGQIALDVIFGSDKNFRKEKLTFELKMPGPKGLITVTGNRKRAEECLQQGSRIADQQMAILELDEYKKTTDPADLMRSKNPASESAFQSAGDTKKVSIHPTDDTAAPTNISTTLDPK
ncbi:hypothetical protein ZWY2020_035912 [Hordeum vulgare]|nr:hypothetical protein ZWY2020_035912 [Hordeum vulgare]